MSNMRELVKIWNKIARDNSEKNSREGEVVTLNDDGSHNIKLTEENGVDYTIQNRWPDDGKSKYPAGTRVILTLPNGSLDRSVIRGNANFNLPSSPTVKHFSTAPSEENIYLCCPDDGKIKVYSLDGTAQTDITIDGTFLNDLCTDGISIYTSGQDYLIWSGYFISKIIKSTGASQTIISQDGEPPTFMTHRGVACNSTYVFCPNFIIYLDQPSCKYIARININNGALNKEWKLICETGSPPTGGTYIDTIYDMCGDSNYLYVLGEDLSGGVT